MSLWSKKVDDKSNDLSNALANAQAEAMYRTAINSGPGAFNSIGDLSRRITEPYYGTPAVDIEDQRQRRNMLAMRLRIKEGELWGFDHIDTALGKDKVFVFILQGDSPAVLEDDAALFPSDTLITQLRLIRK